MELNRFISETILSVCRGVREARDKACKEFENGVIAPAKFNGIQVQKIEYEISFDIQISVTETERKGKEASAKISVIGGGISKETTTHKENANRIKFSVPFYPTALGKPPEAQEKRTFVKTN